MHSLALLPPPRRSHAPQFINFPIYLLTTKEQQEEVPIEEGDEAEEEDEEEEVRLRG